MIGIKADILTKYGTLCNEGFSTDYAGSFVFVNVARSEPISKYGQAWAQTGYCFWRSEGSSTKYYSTYAEVCNGDTANWDFYTIYDPELTIHTYECKLDVSTGVWHFHKDNVEEFVNSSFIQIPAYWAGTTAIRAHWQAEIHNQEDDMVGTYSSRCIISNCQYDNGTGYIHCEYVPSDLVDSDNRNEWQIERLDSNVIEIWDVNPN